jgi:hypothetical protein
MYNLSFVLRYNSKEYKVLNKNTYESLKRQLRVYQQDVKIEHKEKEHFQQECLKLESELKRVYNCAKGKTRNEDSFDDF